MEDIRGYCIDSDILIDYLRGIEYARVFLSDTGVQSTLFISTVSVVELYAGKETRNQEKRERLELFLGNFEIIPLNGIIARTAGALRRDYQKPFADMIIAASAIEYKLYLATRNIKHFQLLEKGTGLKLVKPY